MQPNLIPIELEDGTVIHIQTEASSSSTRDLTATQQAVQASFKALQTLIRGYTLYTINAFRNLGSGDITEVNLEFGVGVSAKSGVPYIASGTADCNVKISVKCEFSSEKSFTRSS